MPNENSIPQDAMESNENSGYIQVPETPMKKKPVLKKTLPFPTLKSTSKAKADDLSDIFETYQESPFTNETVPVSPKGKVPYHHVRLTSESLYYNTIATGVNQQDSQIFIDHPSGHIRPLIKSSTFMKNPPTANVESAFNIFAMGNVEFEESEWTYEKVMEALQVNNWRTRSEGEVIKAGDILQFTGYGEGKKFEHAQNCCEMTLTREHMESGEYIVHTREGGGKKKSPPHNKTTADYASMFEVPKHFQLKLPKDRKEAERFFGCEVMYSESFEAGKAVDVFYPLLTNFRDKKFRSAFSRIFSDFARRVLRNNLKGLIYGRGEGISLKRHTSIKEILDMSIANPNLNCNKINEIMQIKIANETNAKKKAILKAKATKYLAIGNDTIAKLLTNNNYLPKNVSQDGPPKPFLYRMESRQLTPKDFNYSKALGIEIETGSPIPPEEAKKAIPQFMRVAHDGSIKNLPDGYHPVEFRILIKRSEMETRVLKAVESLNRLGGKGVVVNKTCGLHVHFDMRDKTEQEAYMIAEKVQKWLRVLWELVPVSRRDNKYCNFEADLNAHHSSISAMSYQKHKTIEVRAHSSTTDHIKIIQWIRLMETLIETKFSPILRTSTLDGLKMLPLSEADRTYWLKRHAQLNPKMYKEKNHSLDFLNRPDEIE